MHALHVLYRLSDITANQGGIGTNVSTCPDCRIEASTIHNDPIKGQSVHPLCSNLRANHVIVLVIRRAGVPFCVLRLPYAETLFFLSPFHTSHPRRYKHIDYLLLFSSSLPTRGSMCDDLIGPVDLTVDRFVAAVPSLPRLRASRRND
jgi:hypothetical protein